MTCYFHQIGASANLKVAQTVTIQGKTEVLVAGTEGVVQAIDESNHTILVKFAAIDTEIALPSRAFSEPEQSTTHWEA